MLIVTSPDYLSQRPDGQVVSMLILTRRIGETIRIGDDVSLTVLDAKGGGAKIGITAPKEVAVHREEIYDKIAREDEENSARSSTVNKR